jgi:hypothetical protein
MFTKIPAMKLAQKALAATVVCGAVALGTGGAAFATTGTTNGSGSTTTARHFNCARAPKILARIDKVEAKVTKRLPKLEAAESKASSAGHSKLAARIENRINKLEKVNTKVAALATKIETKCPAGNS